MCKDSSHTAFKPYTQECNKSEFSQGFSRRFMGQGLRWSLTIIANVTWSWQISAIIRQKNIIYQQDISQCIKNDQYDFGLLHSEHVTQVGDHAKVHHKSYLLHCATWRQVGNCPYSLLLALVVTLYQFTHYKNMFEVPHTDFLDVPRQDKPVSFQAVKKLKITKVMQPSMISELSDC